MSNQLIKTTELGKENVFPRTRILDLFDDTSGLKLIDILKSFNMMFVPYLGNKSYTRNQISPELRRQGLWLTYVIDNTVYTEWYDEVAIDDTNWGSDSNWRQGSNALVGDLSISPNGTWVINGEDSGITIKGDKGDSPVIRIYDNKILVSYDKGVTYEDLNNTPVYTKFRFNSLTNTYLVSYDLGDTWLDISNEKVYHKFRYNSTTNTYLESVDFGKTWSNISAEKVYYKFRYNVETNTHLVSTDLGLNWTDVSSNKVYYQFRTNDNRLLVSTDLGTTWENCSEPIAAWFRWANVSGTGNVGKVLISRDNNTWEDLSPTMTNNLYIKGYVAAVGNLPSNAAIGDIYMVGPTYDESDTTHDYPHYRMWVKQSSGWVDNGEYQSNILISLTTGLETGITMSLKAITNAIEEKVTRATDDVLLNINETTKKFTKENLKYTIIGNYAINIDNGSMIAGNSYMAAECEVTQGEFIEFWGTPFTSTNIGTIFLDADNNIIKGYHAEKRGYVTLAIPEGTVKIKTSWAYAENNNPSISIKSYIEANVYNIIESEIENNRHYSDSEQFELDNLINTNTCSIVEGDIIEGTDLGNYGINATTGELIPQENYRAFEYSINNISAGSVKYIKVYTGAWTNPLYGMIFLDNDNNIIASYRSGTNSYKYIHIPYMCVKIRTFYFGIEYDVKYVTVTPIEASQIKTDLNKTKTDLTQAKADLNYSINVLRHNSSSEEFELDSLVNTNTCSIVEGDIIEGTDLGNYVVNTLTGKLDGGSSSHHAVEYNIGEVTADKMRYIKIYQQSWTNPYNGTVFYDKDSNILAVYRARTIGWKYIHIPYKCTKIKTTYSGNIPDVRYVTVSSISASELKDKVNRLEEVTIDLDDLRKDIYWKIANNSKNAIMCSYGIEPSYALFSRFCASYELGTSLQNKLVDIKSSIGCNWYGEASIAEKDGFIYAAGMYNMDGGEHGDNPIAIKLTKINKLDMSIVQTVDVTRCDKELSTEVIDEDGVIRYNYSSYIPLLYITGDTIRVIYSTGQDNKNGTEIVHTEKYTDFDTDLNLLTNGTCKINAGDSIIDMTWSAIGEKFGHKGRGHFTVGFCGYDSDTEGNIYLGIASGTGPFCVIASTTDFITYEIKKFIDNKYDCSFENSIIIDGDVMFHAIRTQYITNKKSSRKRRVLWLQKYDVNTFELLDEVAIPDCNTMPRLFRDKDNNFYLFTGSNATGFESSSYLAANRDYYKLIKVDKYDLASSYVICDTNGVQLTNLFTCVDNENPDDFYIFVNIGYIAKFNIPKYNIWKVNDMLKKLMEL